MSAYFVITYNIEDKEVYEKYNPGCNDITAATVAKHGGEILSIGENPIQLHGSELQMKIIMKFPSSQDAKNFYEDEDYASSKAIRLSSTKDINVFIVDELNI